MGYWYLRRKPKTVASEVDEELRHHLELRIQELQARGLSHEEAEREARRLFGDLEAARRYCRHQDERREDDVQRTLMFQDFLQDVRIGLRSLTRVPVLSLTIVLTVGLGIGATTAIFSAVNAAMLRPLPYADPEALVRIYTDNPPFKFRFSVADYQALQQQHTQFTDIAAFTDRTMTFSDGATAEVMNGRLVTPSFFRVLGMSPALGRDFTEADGRPGSPLAVIATHSFWQQRLGGRTDVIGRTIKLDATDHTVVGVLPPTSGPLERRRDFFIALQFSPPPRRGPFFYTPIARLRHPQNTAAAADELRAINRRIFPIWKSSYQDERATWSMEDLKTTVNGDVRTLAGLSLAAVGLVWLIACANASNLLIARVSSRRQELAVRKALGASRGRVVRHLLAESVVLTSGALLLGAAIAWGGIRLLQTVGATYFPRTQEITIDGWVIGVVVALGVMSAAMFCLVPALQGTGGPLDTALRSSRTSTGTVGARRLRRALVGVQFAIATPLLIVAALLLASLNELKQVDLGFDTHNVITASVRLAPGLYPQPGNQTAFWDELRRRVEAVPGVDTLAFADGRPPREVGNFNNFTLEKYPTPPGQSQPVTPWLAVTPEYFKVLGLTLVDGRLHTDDDARRQDFRAIVVDRAWARRFFPNESAVGKRFRSGGCTDCPWNDVVVGVVSEVKYAGLAEPDQGTVYTPYSGSTQRFLFIRSKTDPAALIGSIRQAVSQLDPTAPLSQVATMDELVEQSIQRPQSLSILVASFAGVALLLSIVGIYGVMGYYVQQNLKDISIRMALGGTSADVLRLVVGHGMAVVVSGVVSGVAVSMLLTRLIQSLLFNVSAANAFTFSVVSLTMVGIALLACLVPARRALGLQPASVLRND